MTFLRKSWSSKRAGCYIQLDPAVSSECGEIIALSRRMLLPHNVIRRHSGIHRTSCRLLLRTKLTKYESTKRTLGAAENLSSDQNDQNVPSYM